MRKPLCLFERRWTKNYYEKKKAYEIKQLMKEKRSEEYEVLEVTAESNQRYAGAIRSLAEQILQEAEFLP